MMPSARKKRRFSPSKRRNRTAETETKFNNCSVKHYSFLTEVPQKRRGDAFNLSLEMEDVLFVWDSAHGSTFLQSQRPKSQTHLIPSVHPVPIQT